MCCSHTTAWSQQLQHHHQIWPAERRSEPWHLGAWTTISISTSAKQSRWLQEATGPPITIKWTIMERVSFRFLRVHISEDHADTITQTARQRLWTVSLGNTSSCWFVLLDLHSCHIFYNLHVSHFDIVICIFFDFVSVCSVDATT